MPRFDVGKSGKRSLHIPPSVMLSPRKRTRFGGTDTMSKYLRRPAPIRPFVIGRSIGTISL
jgi:hypothetical protein